MNTSTHLTSTSHLLKNVEHNLTSYSNALSPFIQLWGNSIHQSSLTVHNVMTIVSLISFISTAATCTAAPLQPYGYASCVFSCLSFMMTFLLHILLGINLLFPPSSNAGLKELYFKLADQYTSKVKGTIPKGSKTFISNMEKFENMLDYHIYEDRKCVSVDVSKLSLGLLSNARQTVCITQLGVKKLTEKHVLSGTRIKQGISKQLGKTEYLNKSVKKQLVKLFSNMGSESDKVVPAMSELADGYISGLSKQSGVHVNFTHHKELLFDVALELL